jgi:4-aminobutyrate aminotransferase-like enzyme/Ser/Thr protein kinase RdoA (MazF antagonist)
MLESSAKEILKKNWGISSEISALTGERDLNYQVRSEPKRILKIYPNCSDGEIDFLKLQDRALTSLQALQRTPVPIATKSGETTIPVETGAARLLSWLDGQMWAESDSREFAELGRCVALVDQHLARLALTETDVKLLNRDFIWNMMQAEKILNRLDLIADEKLRISVADEITEFKDKFLPKLKEMKSQLIHNDANDWNIVCGEKIQLIDFGDIILAPRIVGLAVTASYLALDSEDPTFEIAKLVRGYHSISPLTLGEIELLLPLTRVRIAMSIANAALQISENPGNAYLGISQSKTPGALASLAAVDENYALFRFRNALGLEANPRAKAIRNYLNRKVDIHDVVAPPLNKAKKVWIDWSIDNPKLPRSSAEIAAVLKESGAALGIGRYCENRWVYESADFDSSDPNARTFHLGVDLWMEVGAPVYAPLDGIVELFNDNAKYLDYGPVVILRHNCDDGTPFWTLYGHLSKQSLKNWQIGKEFKAGELIGWMGDESENVGWPPHVHFQLLTDLCGMGIDVYGVAPREEVSLWRGISLNPNLILRIPEGVDAHSRISGRTIKEERLVAIGRNLSLNFKEPLHIVAGEGAYLIDESGNRYLDLVNNVAHVGHGHPRLVAAAARQMATLNTNTRYLHQSIIEYARSLISTLPDPLSVLYFVNSGSEANDLAIRMAKAHTKRTGFLALDHAYHGHTDSVVEISPYKFFGKGGAGKPRNVNVAKLPDLFRGDYRSAGAAEKYLKDAVNQLDSLTEPIAAFFSESIVSTAGQIVLPPGYLTSVFKEVRSRGGICVSDEVQIGLGRVGEQFWGFQLQGVVPDIVTMGKPLGNGHPLAAVATTAEIASSFNNGMEYFNTFGGNPVSSVIGQTVFDIVMDEALQLNALQTGQYLMNSMKELSNSHSMIADVRGRGLFIGVEMMRDEKTPATAEVAELMEFALAKGVLLSCDGPDNNVLKIKPPLIINNAQVDHLTNVISDWLSQ